MILQEVIIHQSHKTYDEAHESLKSHIL